MFIDMASRSRFVLAAIVSLVAAPLSSDAAQEHLVPNTAISGSTLAFDWPGLEIGVATYEEGPTGLTIFRFLGSGAAVVDVRGGSPGTVNTDMLRLGSEDRFLDAIVFTGGSIYGHEAIAAVSTGLKDAGKGSGLWDDAVIVAGAEIYDYTQHRLNEIYPDKTLARAALAAMRPGVFPQGAQGAGRAATQGGFFRCGAHSGQGGAFRQIGDVKLAAFTVINALGTITDRDGRIVRCNQDPATRVTRTAELLARVGAGAGGPARPPATPTNPSLRNTTLSLVVTNRKLSYANLQRLAIQTHTSMARGIQPFSTSDDGDIMFVVSTQQIETETPDFDSFAAMTGELMWDAILASVPPEPVFRPPATDASVPVARLAPLVGSYRFGPNALIKISLQNGRLMAESLSQSFRDLRRNEPVLLRAISENAFYVDGRYRTRITFTRENGGSVTGAMINPGPWQQAGSRTTK
jgi:L-aminopeptidase/D-esterase-like protein